MKDFLFDTISNVSVASIKASDWIGSILIQLIVVISGLHRAAIGKFCASALNLTDKDRLDKAVAELEAKAADMELKVLAAGIRIRDHAISSEGWTHSHTEAIEAVGNTLINQFQWDQQAAHEWIQRVVDEVPGVDVDPWE